jgi:hypothetical protein
MVHRREVLLLVEVGTRQLDDSVVTTFNRERAYEQLQRGFGSTTRHCRSLQVDMLLSD